MIGLEVAAAVFGIIGGIATATKMASDLRELYVKKKKGKGGAAKSISETIEQRLRRLETQLSTSEIALQEYRRLNARLSSEIQNDAVNACNATLENIAANLRHIEATSPELALQTPHTLNLRALEQLLDRWRIEADHVVQVMQSVKHDEGSRIIVPSTFAEAGSSNLCPYAVLYRNNQCHFDKVAVFRHRASGIQEWACRFCGAIMSRASMPLSLEKSGRAQVYITPVGFFKGHSARNEEGAWSCIWQRRSKECSESFGRRRDLLRHMQEIHVKGHGNNGMFNVDLPADGRELNAAKCGYGVSLAGDEMRMVKGGFIAT